MMLNRFIVPLGVAGVLAACANMQPVDPGLANLEGISIDNPGATVRYIESISVTRSATPKGAETLARCAALNVPNQQVTLKDSEGSFFGAFTGRYYRNTNLREVGGGDGLRYASEDGETLVTAGTGRYDFSFLGTSHTRALRYKLAIESTGDETRYEFTQLQQAQIDTGSAANTGFDKVGAWSGASPTTVHSELMKVVDSMDACIKRFD